MATAGWIAVVVTVSMWMRHRTPALIFGDAVHDDHHFVAQSDQIIHGHWLGEFTPTLTLAKGPAYPAFVAACRAIGVPLLPAEHALHLLAASLCAAVLWRLTRSGTFAVASFTVLALDPSYIGGDASRVIRDNWYGSICLLLVSWLCMVVLRLGRPAPTSGARDALLAVGHGTAIGVLATAYYLGREERPWLAPAALLLVAAALFVSRRNGRARLGELTVVVLVAVMVVTAALEGLAVQNKEEYGVALTNDLVSGSFPRAFAAWQSIDAGPARRYVPISRAQRAAAYDVSPAAKELAYYLDGPAATGWIHFGCDSVGVCDDLAGGWIPWAIREAVTGTGRYNTGETSQEFYTRLADEIRSACQTKQLLCDRTLPSLLPDPDLLSARELGHSLRTASSALVTFRASTHRADDGPASVSSDASWDLFRSVVVGLPPTAAEQRAVEQRYSEGVGNLLIWKRGWGYIAPWICLVSLIGLIVTLITRPPRWKWPFAIALVAYAAVAGRLAMLALVDSTSFPAAQSGYLLLPASSFLLMGTALGVYLLQMSIARIVRAVQERSVS